MAFKEVEGTGDGVEHSDAPSRPALFVPSHCCGELQ
jgi:hypothetical protein